MLTIKNLQLINKLRCNKDFRPVDDWSLPQYGNAIAGEVGELCNIIKKMDRLNVPGDSELSTEDIGKELADIICYACLIASRADLNLEDCIKQKFNEVSKRVDSKYRL